MIEILITLLIVTFGLLALGSYVTRTTTLTADASQRARAAAFLGDMAQRIANNKLNAGTYPSLAAGKEIGKDANNDCDDVSKYATLQARDVCEWNDLLAGANEGVATGFLGFRGCITQPNVADPLFVVSVAWGVLTPGLPPPVAETCGQGKFGVDDTQRRVLRTQIRIANLS